VLQHKYSNKIFGKKILIIGPYPPPLGGVSIHIKRVKKKLENQKNHVFIFDTSKKFKRKFLSFKNFVKTIFKIKPEIVFFHEPTESVQKLFVTVFLKLFLKYKLLTIDHDCRLLYNFKFLKKLFLKSILKKIDEIVVIGNTTEKCYIDNKIKILHKTSVESPFLKPNLREEEKILKKLPNSVHDFLKEHSPIISANAFVPTILPNGGDLYGFDLCIELIKSLKKTNPTVGLIFGICKIETESHKKYFEKIKKEIKKFNLENNFYFLTSDQEFWPIIKKSDLFVRPTLSDSFGISVHEAITFGVPTIASDVCTRPEGAILFKKENLEQFIQNCFIILESPRTTPNGKPGPSMIKTHEMRAPGP